MRIIKVLLATSFIIPTAYSQNNANMMKELEAAVLKTVKEWNTAFVHNDPETYFKFVHNDLSLFLASSPYRIEGKIDDREEFEWSLRSGRTRVSLFQELQPKVQMLSEGSALVTYHTRGIYGHEGQEQLVHLKETNILVKEENEWKIIHIHVSK